MRLLIYVLLFIGIWIVGVLGEVLNVNTLDPTEDALSEQPDQLKLADVGVSNLTFKEFKSKWGKRYSTTGQQKYRQQIFTTNLAKLNEHNSNPLRTYNMKANQFLDVSSDQFRNLYTATYQSNENSKALSKNLIQKQKNTNCQDQINNTYSEDSINNYNDSLFDGNISKIQQQIILENQPNSSDTDQMISANLQGSSRRLTEQQSDIATNNTLQSTKSSNNLSLQNTTTGSPDNDKNYKPQGINIDWTMYSGSIKYQGICGACYAFSSVDTVAALNAINTFGFFVPLSVQQIIDCVDNGLTYGCSGGFLEGAFTYIQMKGITTDYSYPYASSDNGIAGKCQIDGGPFKVSSFDPLTEGDCQSVLTELEKGPVSVGISGYQLQFYDSGIFSDCTNVLDHAVVVVGYKSGVGWKIKNSWGVDWGQSGYGWIAEGNHCGICNMALSAKI